MTRHAALLACLLATACEGFPQPVVPDTARLAPGALGTFADPDVTAVQQAQWAFADPGRTRNRPVEAARAAASMDYVAGKLYESPRWSYISALTKEMLLRGRVEVRAALGVQPDATSQQVVDRLTFAAHALEADDTEAAESALGGPVFAQDGAATLQRLANLPYMQAANVSTMRAGNELFGPGSGNSRL